MGDLAALALSGMGMDVLARQVRPWAGRAMRS
jgi:hypothetical protein